MASQAVSLIAKFFDRIHPKMLVNLRMGELSRLFIQIKLTEINGFFDSVEQLISGLALR